MVTKIVVEYEGKSGEKSKIELDRPDNSCDIVFNYVDALLKSNMVLDYAERNICNLIDNRDKITKITCKEDKKTILVMDFSCNNIVEKIVEKVKKVKKVNRSINK